MANRPELREGRPLKEDLVGWQELESVDVKCGDCGTPLVNVVLTEPNHKRQERYLTPLLTQYKVKCYKCGGDSFRTKVFHGSTVVGAIKDGIRIDEIDTEKVNEGVVFITLSTEKE